MEALLLALIGKLNSSVFVLLLILIITCIVLYKLGYWAHKFAAHDKHVENIEGLARDVVSLTTKVDLIYQFVNPHSEVSKRESTGEGQRTPPSLLSDSQLS